jgi:hypothetical protein
VEKLTEHELVFVINLKISYKNSEGAKLLFLIKDLRPLKNLVIFTILKKTMDIFEVTGGRVLSFRNVSVGEPAGPDLSGQCG